MGGASSASAVPAASAAGGYSSPASMARATIGGTTGSNVAGMGYVPRAQAAGQGGVNYAKIAEAFGGAVKDSFGKVGSSIAGQQYGLGGMAPSDAFTPMTSSPFAGLAGAMPQVRSAPFRMATSAAGPLRQTGMGYTI